jgi:DNA-binding protein HU-beta
MSSSYTKAELISKISADTGLKKADAEKALMAALDGVRDALAGGNKVTIVGFGTFSVGERAARKGLNPRTKETIDIPSSKVVKFKPGKALRDSVN